MKYLGRLCALCAITGTALSPVHAQETKQVPRDLDAVIYIGDQAPPKTDAKADGAGYDSAYGNANETPANAYSIRQALYYERELAVWKDPLTLPHSRSECVKWASGHIPFDGDWKTCIGWKLQFQWLYVRAVLAVTASKPEHIDRAVEECLRTAAVAAALAAIVSGGTAAVGTFEAVMKGCLVEKLASSVSVTVRTPTYWGDWE